MIHLFVVFAVLVGANAGPATEASFRGQFCVDPRTMRKHAAYTEWADAYSCTRHRCQPGGRNLAIYTVGCKRVEAPESAIECEEVVEDTNMQFPYCCTRLRCLVVVRGEVWTRVLGQPWETLPAAPWSHMYKMKKPPPGSEKTFLPKLGEGPVYELQRESMTDDEAGNKVLRSKKSKGGEAEDCSNDVSHTGHTPPQQPDIVIALSTNLDKETKKDESPPASSIGSASKSMTKHQRGRSGQSDSFFEEDALQERVERRGERGEREGRGEGRGEQDAPDAPDAPKEELIPTQKPADPPVASEEKYNNYPTTQKPHKQTQRHQVAWTEIPQNQWNEHEPEIEPDALPKTQPVEPSYLQPAEQPSTPDDKKQKPGNLQALVDAIGTRMRDIESAVQRMSEKVQKVPEIEQLGSGEKTSPNQIEPEHHEGREKMKRPAPEGDSNVQSARYNVIEPEHHEKDKVKRPSPEGDNYRRGSRYLHTPAEEVTTEPPLFIEDSHLNGYFSDASNSVLRRSNNHIRPAPLEPAQETYMAPVQSLTNRRTNISPPPSSYEDSSSDKKTRKKKVHKKKRAKIHHKKHHPKDDKHKKYRLNSVELDKNAVSLEESAPNNNANNNN